VTDVRSGIRAAQIGVVVNAALAGAKFAAGILGTSYALVADAVESLADIVSSLIVWGGLHISAQPADEDHPFGHGKAEALAAAVVSMMLIAAAILIAIHSIHEIRTPHRTPAPWTLAVLVAVMVIKWLLSRWVREVGDTLESQAVTADATHHLSDVVTSAAAFIGITIAVIGSRYAGGTGWEQADDWAALLASGVIGYNGFSILRGTIDDLMDRVPGKDVIQAIERAAHSVPEVKATEKLTARRSGTTYWVTLHVQAAPSMSLEEAHVVSGKVKSAIRAAVPRVAWALVHMEPYGVDHSEDRPRAPNRWA
jgi:cation diffusion facilitator family transporter